MVNFKTDCSDARITKVWLNRNSIRESEIDEAQVPRAQAALLLEGRAKVIDDAERSIRFGRPRQGNRTSLHYERLLDKRNHSILKVTLEGEANSVENKLIRQVADLTHCDTGLSVSHELFKVVHKHLGPDDPRFQPAINIFVRPDLPELGPHYTRRVLDEGTVERLMDYAEYMIAGQRELNWEHEARIPQEYGGELFYFGRNDRTRADAMRDCGMYKEHIAGLLHGREYEPKQYRS